MLCIYKLEPHQPQTLVFLYNLAHTINDTFFTFVQYNPNGSNLDGSFTVDDSNSFFSPYKILPTAQENKYEGIFFLFNHGIVCCVYSLESPHCVENQKDYPKLSLFAS